MDVNVIKLIRKKVKNKGKARVKGEEGAVGLPAAAFQPKPLKLVDRRDPLDAFADMSIEEIYDEMDSYLQSTVNIDPRVVRIFNILRAGMPWDLVQPFFREYRETGTNILTSFEEFWARQDTKDRVLEMQKEMQRRKATPIVFVRPLRIMASQPRQLIRLDPIPVNQRIAPMFGEGDLLSKCESEYRRAPWMYQFTAAMNQPGVRGMVLRTRRPGYSALPVTFNGVEWYNPSQKWYKDACEGRRGFIPNEVAYVTVDKKLIVETMAMYNASKTGWQSIIDTEFAPVDRDSFDAAKAMLETSILPKDDINAVLASLSNNGNTNIELARNLSWVLVFLSKLIKEPQVHHYRVINKLYQADDIVRLDRYTLLPEVYKNPNIDHEQTEYIIKNKRRVVENRFYNRYNALKNPGMRIRTLPEKMNVFAYTSTNSNKLCPTDTQDVAYYNEGGRMYCFDRLDVYNQTRNPQSGQYFDQEFKDEMKLMKAPLVEAFCNQCSKEIPTVQYRSVLTRGDKSAEIVHFCDKDCFDKFNFESK